LDIDLIFGQRNFPFSRDIKKLQFTHDLLKFRQSQFGASSMKCPACNNQLSPLTAGDVVVDVCRDGCGGVWFDDREIEKFDEQAEVDGEKIMQIMSSGKPALNDTRCCPKCSDEVLCKTFFDVQRRVRIDQCLRCSGIWLDAGELQAIRGQYQTVQEREQAEGEYLGSQLKETTEILEQESALKVAQEGPAIRLMRRMLGGYFTTN
jgi:Zn-finger nucleic acid-binding protein